MTLTRSLVLFSFVLTGTAICFAAPPATVGNFCQPPKLTAPGPGYTSGEVKNQPDKTADLPSVIQTVEQALKCYQALTVDPDQPKGFLEDRGSCQ